MNEKDQEQDRKDDQPPENDTIQKGGDPPSNDKTWAESHIGKPGD